MKIQELTQKIYQDGVEKARQEEKGILDSARRESEAMLAAAREEASRIVGEAERQAQEARSKLQTEIALGAEQALSLLRQRVSDLLIDASLTPAVSSAFEDTPFIESLIRSVVEKWDPHQTSLDLSIVLSETERAHFEDFFRSRARDLIEKGLEVRFGGRMGRGFVIGPQDNSYKLSFDEGDFVAFFKSFLRQHATALLFPGSNG